MPLTGIFLGECSADSGAVIPPDTLRHCCNPGHARAMCARAAAIETDAVQLLVTSDHEGVIEIAWAMERNHHPVAVGKLPTSRNPESANPTLNAQARAFAAQYRRQKGRG